MVMLNLGKEGTYETDDDDTDHDERGGGRETETLGILPGIFPSGPGIRDIPPARRRVVGHCMTSDTDLRIEEKH